MIGTRRGSAWIHADHRRTSRFRGSRDPSGDAAPGGAARGRGAPAPAGRGHSTHPETDLRPEPPPDGTRPLPFERSLLSPPGARRKGARRFRQSHPGGPLGRGPGRHDRAADRVARRSPRRIHSRPPGKRRLHPGHPRRPAGIGPAPRRGSDHRKTQRPRGRDLADLRRLLAGARFPHRAASIRQAVPAVREYARRFRLIIHYGAYDLIGVNLEMLRAAETPGTRLVFLVPHHPSSRAYDLTRRFWPEFLGVPPVRLADATTDRLLAERLPLLYDE